MSDNERAEAQRREPRQETDGNAKVRVLEGPFPELKNTNFDADVVDVSESGCRLDCDELLDQCTLLMRITLSGSSESVPIRGEVRWASWEEGGKYQMGVEFTGNDSPVVIKWHEMMKALQG